MSKRLDRLALLETFARIARRGSISAAARDLGLSQASASRQLAELETRLGVQLIRRSTHELSLTSEGHQCLADADAIRGAWDALEERFREDQPGALRGAIRAVVPVALGQLHLTAAAVDFQRRHPEVSVTWTLDDEEIRFTEIGCDIWIKIGRPKDERLIVRSIATIERMVVASPTLLASGRIGRPQQLASIPCVALAPFEGHRMTLTSKRGAKAMVAATASFVTDNIFAAHQAAVQGIGFAVMPRWFIAEDLQHGRLVDLLPTWRAPKLTLSAALSPAGRRSKRRQLFLAHLLDALRQVDGMDPQHK